MRYGGQDEGYQKKAPAIEGQGQCAWNQGSSQRYHISGTYSRIVTSSLRGHRRKKKRPPWPLSSSPIANSELMAIRLSSFGLGRSPSSFWLILGPQGTPSGNGLTPNPEVVPGLLGYGLMSELPHTEPSTAPSQETFNFVAQKESRQQLGGFASFLTARVSGNLLPPSPPAEKATASEN
jgi:hypothetical protein